MHETPAAGRPDRDNDQAEHIKQDDRNMRRQDGFGRYTAADAIAGLPGCGPP